MTGDISGPAGSPSGAARKIQGPPKKNSWRICHRKHCEVYTRCGRAGTPRAGYGSGYLQGRRNVRYHKGTKISGTIAWEHTAPENFRRSTRMTRGRHPVRAQEEADRIAKKRGMVQHYQHEPDMLCDFTITTTVYVTHARIKRVRRLGCTAGELERHASSEIALLRSIASSPAISRELWLCSPTYAWRFFRIGDHTITEIDGDGRPVSGQATYLVAPGTAL